MKRILGIMLISTLFCSSVRGEDIQWNALHRKIGHVTPAYYSLYSVFGIEQWEDGKLTTHRRQQWTIDCDYTVATNPPTTSCKLTRVVIDEGLPPGTAPIISAHRHSTSDGTLRLITTDWEGGKLDFSIVNSDNSTTEAMLRMKIKDTLIFLDSFKATAITRGTSFLIPLTTIEYRLPKYTYTLNVPVVMRGLQPMGQKAWDETSATLSKQDQKAWEEFKNKKLSQCENGHISDEEVLKKIIPNEARRLELETGASLTTSDEQTKMMDYFAGYRAGELAKCVANAELSAIGKKKVLDLLKKELKSPTSKAGYYDGSKPRAVDY